MTTDMQSQSCLVLHDVIESGLCPSDDLIEACGLVGAAVYVAPHIYAAERTQRAAVVREASRGIGRFPGRKVLEVAALDGNDVALNLLRMPRRDRDVAVASGGAVYWERALLPAAIRAKRAERAARRMGRDRLSERKPGNVLGRALHRAVKRSLAVSRFREALHSHDVRIVIVEPGQEGASSDTGQARPSSVGLPAAYSAKGYWVTTSEHVFRVSASFFATPRRERAGRGWLQLTPALRAVQSRGTSIRTENV